MADLSYHLDRGESLVVKGTAASTQDVEVIIDNAVGVTKKDALLALERIKDAIQEDLRFAEI